MSGREVPGRPGRVTRTCVVGLGGWYHLLGQRQPRGSLHRQEEVSRALRGSRSPPLVHARLHKINSLSSGLLHLLLLSPHENHCTAAASSVCKRAWCPRSVPSAARASHGPPGGCMAGCLWPSGEGRRGATQASRVARVQPFPCVGEACVPGLWPPRCATCAGAPTLDPCVPFGKHGFVCLGDSKREPDPPPESWGSDL